MLSATSPVRTVDRQSSGMFASNFVPLWCGCAAAGGEAQAAAVIRSLRRSGLVQPGGVATSLYTTGESSMPSPAGAGSLRVQTAQVLANHERLE